jgi:hypothetical protein
LELASRIGLGTSGQDLRIGSILRMQHDEGIRQRLTVPGQLAFDRMHRDPVALVATGGCEQQEDNSGMNVPGAIKMGRHELETPFAGISTEPSADDGCERSRPAPLLTLRKGCASWYEHANRRVKSCLDVKYSRPARLPR